MPTCIHNYTLAYCHSPTHSQTHAHALTQMGEGLMMGEEGTVCEIIIDKLDGSGIFICHLVRIVRRPKV